MSPSIALVGFACIYPDARSPAELWENVLAGRRAFRRLPSERLRAEDYWSPDRGAADRTYAVEAALIEGYEFDRVRFRVAGDSFRAADLTHWLALDVAAEALADAGLGPGTDGDLPHETTGVFLGNTLTGEFSRAQVLRLRWPYARRMVEAELCDEGWAADRRREFLDSLESKFKAPFPAVGEETLAGGLSNTIAGRICNHFDFQGGGYTVDGACASSLLAVAHACSALAAGDLDLALAGGVDLSLDPFEMVGFAKAGALAQDVMRVYDARSAGFWPGEGCGLVVLMRLADALAQGRRIVAVIRGWGISSDGQGGLTRPEVHGQVLALRRAYRRAGFGIETVAYFEGHGTGTGVGDATELRALGRALREASPAEASPAVIGTVKANIGHTKAAAGVAGLIKAAKALEAQVLPPITGCEQPHFELTGDRPVLQVLKRGRLWPADRPLRAGVSAMGFGGINAHVVLESLAEDRRREGLTARELALLGSAQDAELFLLGARHADELSHRVEDLRGFAGRLSLAELADLAAHLGGSLSERTVRAAIVASRPAELVERLESLRDRLDSRNDGSDAREPAATTRWRRPLDPVDGVYLSPVEGSCRPRIGFLFPGQGSPATLDGGAWSRRFRVVEDRYRRAGLPAEGDLRSTEVAQPAIITASLAALDLLGELGIEAEVAVGHSLGELTALCWAGVYDGEALIRLAGARGQAMAGLAGDAGAMASLEAGRDAVEALVDGEPVVIAGCNAPRQTVISGPVPAVDAVLDRAQRHGIAATRLEVSHAFHSSLVARAADPLAQVLVREPFARPLRSIASTVTGALLSPETDLRQLLVHQVTAPVRFLEAMSEAARGIDLWIEAGPGRVLTGLTAGWVPAPVVATEAGGESLAGLLHAAGAAFALGAPLTPAPLFAARATRPFPTPWRPRFFTNPCELAPLPKAAPEDRDSSTRREEVPDRIAALPPIRCGSAAGRAETVLDLVRTAVAARAELPPGSVQEESRLLGDLHLNSIAVSRLVADLARRIGVVPPVEPVTYSTATVGQVAEALEELARGAVQGMGTGTALDFSEASPRGVAPWFRVFAPTRVERPRPVPHSRARAPAGPWHIIARPGDTLAGRLHPALSRGEAERAVLVCLPPDPDERHVGLLLEAARVWLADPAAERFVLAQHGGAGSSFARTLHLEAPRTATCVVDLPVDHPRSAEWVIAEAGAAAGFTEVHYDEHGRRWEPALRVLPPPAEPVDALLSPEDVLVVSGGGKGIAAECALALARETGVRLALLGRSRPDADPGLAANLERMTASGVAFHYWVADVADARAVQTAVRQAEAVLGPITGVLHGAGINAPCLLGTLDRPAFARTLAPKLQGARNLLAAVQADRLKLLATFGSIIARTGLAGEADYGLANEWLTRLTERFQREHPACRCLALEWSVWSGVGMGDRLGRVDSLARQGITPIPPDEGVALFRRLVSVPWPVVPLVVAGRFGSPPAIPIEGPDLPLLRFLERPRVDYSGVELVADVTLSSESDPYLDDHVFRGERLFPAVMGLEAMAQAAMAVLRTSEPPVFEDVRFDRPIVVPPGRPTTVRLAALVAAPGRVEVVLQSSATAFQADHFRATCRFGTAPAALLDVPNPEPIRLADSARIGVDPRTDLYGGLLFQGGRFRRLRGYLRLRSTACDAEIGEAPAAEWFRRFLPSTLFLGDPAARDATIHALQACIPEATILPIGVDRLIPATASGTGVRLVRARERSDQGDLLVFDVDVLDEAGHLRERWEGLRLRVVERREPGSDWPEPLLGPYLERRLRTMVAGLYLAVEVERDGDGRQEHCTRSDRLFRRVLGSAVSISRRPDGRPEVDGTGGISVSAAHAGDLTIAAAGRGAIACDLERVRTRLDSTWRDLLGSDRWSLAGLIAREAGESLTVAATRAWVALECLTKAGIAATAPLVLRAPPDGRAVLLGSGPFVLATIVVPDREGREPFVVGLLARPDHASL